MLKQCFGCLLKILNSVCLGTRNLTAVRLHVTSVLKQLSSVTLGTNYKVISWATDHQQWSWGWVPVRVVRLLTRSSGGICVCQKDLLVKVWQRVSCLAQMSEFTSRTFCSVFLHKIISHNERLLLRSPLKRSKAVPEEDKAVTCF